MEHDEKAYYERMLSTFEDGYVAADERGDLAGGSGSGGGMVRWERKRRIIAAAFDHDGTWLDTGCANGLLMETLRSWAAEKGVRIEPYGLDLSERIAQRARTRLTAWTDRIWTGNIMSWNPPMRFDYVTLLPEYVPIAVRRALLTRVRNVFLNPRGRLVVSCYRPSSAPGSHTGGAPSAGAMLRELGFAADGAAEVRDDDDSVWTSVAWTDHG